MLLYVGTAVADPVTAHSVNDLQDGGAHSTPTGELGLSGPFATDFEIQSSGTGLPRFALDGPDVEIDHVGLDAGIPAISGFAKEDPGTFHGVDTRLAGPPAPLLSLDTETVPGPEPRTLLLSVLGVVGALACGVGIAWHSRSNWGSRSRRRPRAKRR